MVWRTFWTFHNFILFLYGIVCQRSNTNVRTIVDSCFKHVKLEMLPSNKSNFPTMHDIIYRRRQRSGRDYMAVAFKSSYVIKDLSQFLFGS
jgi:hypothetical protein